jgi:hypothetical protein
VNRPGLTIEAVYDDDDLVEVRVAVWNGAFGGRASVYASIEEFEHLADVFAGFPMSVQDHRQFEWGDLSRASGQGGFAMQLTCVDAVGHAGAWVELKSADTDSPMPLQTVRLFLPIEAQAVDRFVQDMRVVGRQKRGTAHLSSSAEGGRTSGCS